MKPKIHATFNSWRFHFVLFFILLVTLGLISRVVDLTVVNSSFLQHEGDVRVLRTVSTPAFRGMITDRNGFPLAVSTTVYSVWMNPQEFFFTPKNVNNLAKLLNVPRVQIETIFQKQKMKHREFVYIKRGISPDLAAKVKKLILPGLYLQEDYKRYYPESEVAAHVVGFTNIDDIGQEGLELAYNDWLHGTPGKTLVVKDRLGRAIADVRTLHEQKPGHDLNLSIDRRIQYLAYRELMEGMQKNIASSGTVVILDVKTGEVLAMVNQPSFNPNNKPNHLIEGFRNRAVTDSFEPGSTIKAFSIASALDSGKYTPNSIVDTYPGWMRVDHRVVKDEHNNGPITLAQILQRSSNVGATKVMLSLPSQGLWSMLHRVGFGETTGIGFPGEQSGSLVNRPKWSPFMVATLSFGYGMSTTPLQLAEAYAIFGNKGLKVPISLLKLDKPPQGQQVISEKVAKQMIAMLETVITAPKGTGALARVPGYRVAGKTGTAIMAGQGGYQHHHYTSSFVGLAPATNPRIVIAVIVHDPKGKYYHASIVCAPIFEKIMEGTLRILNIPPDDVADLNKKVA